MVKEYYDHVRQLLADYDFSDSEIEDFLLLLLDIKLHNKDYADVIAYNNNSKYRDAFYQYYEELMSFVYYNKLTKPLSAGSVSIDSNVVSSDNNTITVDSH